MIYLISKRIFDFIFSFIALAILFPFFLIIIIILLMTGEGEVFFLQERLGFLNKKFKIIKFATMVKNSSKIGTGSLTLRNDPRVLPFGRLLRKSKINELPQILNVILGDMSIVGPRPQMQVDFDKFPVQTREKIYQSKPGLTGIGSIIFRDEEDWISNYDGDKHEYYKRYIAPYKTELELWYLKKSSFFVDLILVLITVWVIFFTKSNVVYKIFKDLPKKPKELFHV